MMPGIGERTAGVKCPWRENPYALVNWWDMERFAAAAFHDIGTNLGLLGCKLERLPHELDAVELGTVYRPLLEQIRALCAKIDLRCSVICVDDFLGALRYGMTVEQMRHALAELNNSIRREMQVCLFFHMPGEQAKFYAQGDLFGSEVSARFPSIHFDMVEAGNCYAMGRGTACVFHLMRVVEIGVQEFGTALKVSLTGQKNWQNILDEINKAIKALPSKEPKTPGLSQASANLYAVKLAWRNEVMHPNDKYTLEEAKDLIDVVRIFVNQLATII